MPIFEYACRACGHEFETLVRASDTPSCASCGSEALDKKLSVFLAWQFGMGCMKPMPKDEELQQMPGRGKLDFTPLLKTLKDMNYSGYTQIFMHPTPRGIPILPTATEVTAEINRAKAYLEKCLANA